MDLAAGAALESSAVRQPGLRKQHCGNHQRGARGRASHQRGRESSAWIADGSPRELYRTDGSRYRNMLDAEDAVRDRVWSGHPWRRMTLENGRLQEESQIAAEHEVNA